MLLVDCDRRRVGREFRLGTRADVATTLPVWLYLEVDNPEIVLAIYSIRVSHYWDGLVALRDETAFWPKHFLFRCIEVRKRLALFANYR